METFVEGRPNMSVCVRVRPANKREEWLHSKPESQYRQVVQPVDEHVIFFDPPVQDDGFADTANLSNRRLSNALGARLAHNRQRTRDYKFAFDRVFNETATQEEVYQHTAQPLIDAVLNGYNCTVFAYGSTGSGKTHTMIGTEDEAGVMVLTMRDLFDAVDDLKDEKKINIGISYLEVYNETIRDLFVPNSPTLNLVEDPRLGTYVKGLSVKTPKSADQVFTMLAFGNTNRSQSATDANASSSRSHAVLQITVTQQNRTADIESVLCVGKLSLIDLAGSERASVSTNRGERQKEGVNINKSLLALGNCINSLGENYRKGKHVPYRNSKLTRLLKDSLGGNCRTVMIATCGPSSVAFDETLNTLKYANRAKNIKTTIVKNEVNVNHHVSKYTEIIAELQEEVRELKEKLGNNNNNNNASKHRTPSQTPRFSAELEEAKRQLNRLTSDLTQLKLLCWEQYELLAENGLVNDSIQRMFDTNPQLKSPTHMQKWQAWQTPSTANKFATPLGSAKRRQSFRRASPAFSPPFSIDRQLSPNIDGAENIENGFHNTSNDFVDPQVVPLVQHQSEMQPKKPSYVRPPPMNPELIDESQYKPRMSYSAVVVTGPSPSARNMHKPQHQHQHQHHHHHHQHQQQQQQQQKQQHIPQHHQQQARNTPAGRVYIPYKSRASMTPRDRRPLPQQSPYTSVGRPSRPIDHDSDASIHSMETPYKSPAARVYTGPSSRTPYQASTPHERQAVKRYMTTTTSSQMRESPTQSNVSHKSRHHPRPQPPQQTAQRQPKQSNAILNKSRVHGQATLHQHGGQLKPVHRY